MPRPDYRPQSYIKIPLVWSLYYLMKGLSYEEAIKDIISRGGNTRCNAAIVGGLIGVDNGIGEESLNVESLPNITKIVENAPTE